VLSKELSEALRTLSGRESATLFMTMLAAFECLLHRYTGQEEMVVGTAMANTIGELTPCATESGVGPCTLAYFEFDQVFGTELRFKARVAGPSLLDVPTLQRQGGQRQFLFYVDADNSTSTGDQCCQDMGADFYVQVLQTVVPDSASGDSVIATTANIFQWNPCATNVNDCGAVGLWTTVPSGGSQVYNVFIGGTEVQATVPMAAVGNPLGAYSAWVVCNTLNAPETGQVACQPSSLPTMPCQCRMVLTRVPDTNCPAL